MDNDRTEEILSRIESLEQRLDALSARLGQLESMPTPPPRLAPERREAIFARQYMPPAERQPAYTPPQPPSQPKPAAPKKDTEYLIGAQILPKVGALFMLLALTFLVVLAYSRGYITPAMMFGIEVAFCSAFAIVGVAKRDMKEEFGQLLTGIGSCGLYLVFAGGHLYYHLYEGETLVALFFGLSLANLAFSFWRSSRSFLAIGLIGGLITASVLPNMKGDHSVVNAWIHFLILIPAALIVAKNKWLEMAGALWVAATIALIPILTYGLPWYDKAGILYASTAISLAAYGWAYRQTVFDAFNTFTPIMLWIAGGIGLGLNSTPMGAWQFLPFGLIFVGLGILWRGRAPVRNGFLIGAIGVPMTLAPFCYPTWETTGIFAVLSVASALVAYRLVPKAASIAALVEFVLASTTYLGLSFMTVPWRTEAILIAIQMLAVVLANRVLTKAWGQDQIFAVGAMAICIPYLSRFGSLMLGLTSVGPRPEYAFAWVLLLFAYYALALQLRTRWESMRIAFWLLFAFAFCTYWAAVELLAMPLDMSLLIPLMAAPILGAVLTPETSKKVAGSSVSVIVGVLFTRFCVLLGPAMWHVDLLQAATVGALIYAAGSFLALLAYRKDFLAVGGWVLFVYGAFSYMFNTPPALLTDLWQISGVLAVLALGGRATAILARNSQEYRVVLALAGWVAFSRWSWVLIALYFNFIGSSPSISVGWTAYALGLLVIGFLYRVVEFRYVSFAVMAAVVAKVLLVDLATTDQMLRVGIVMAVALVMIGMGYWYIRSRQHQELPG